MTSCDMENLHSIRELVDPIIGGYWGREFSHSGNARVIRNGDVLENGAISKKVPLRTLEEKEIKKASVISGDILITISGNVGRAALVIDEFDSAGIPFVASNFVKVLRCNRKEILPEYLFYYLRSDFFLGLLSKFTRGVAIQNLSTKIFDQKIIPVIPIAEQKRIVSILEEAEAFKKKRAEADQKMEDLIPSLFMKMFGNPLENTMNWQVVSLRGLGNLDRGKSQHRPRTAQELFGGLYPFVQTGDVTNAGWKLSHCTQTYSEKGLAQSKLWPKGTLCITIAANIAKTTILDFEACFPDSVVGFTANEEESNVDYVQALFLFLQKGLQAMAPQAAQQNINLQILRELQVPKPPIKLQNDFAKLVKEIEIQKEKQRQSSEKIYDVFQSLLARAFSGES